MKLPLIYWSIFSLLIIPFSPVEAATKHMVHSHLKLHSASGNSPSGYSPNQISVAYGLDSLEQDGSGQVIGIVDAYDAPTISQDLSIFSQQFHLPILPTCTVQKGKDSCFEKTSVTTKLPAKNAGWAQESSLDVEWAHAIAPKASILLVEAQDSSLDSLMAAVDVATKRGATVVSMSWGGPEFSNETTYDSHFRHAGTLYVASSGDNGTERNYPAASPLVLSVGGTSLSLNAHGTRIGDESAWSGSGGGISHYETIPSYQKKFASSNRTIPDVSYNADPNTGYAIYDATPFQGNSGWLDVGGTSAGAPQWAALTARINQVTTAPLTITANQNPFYLQFSKNAATFHDIFSGENGSCTTYCIAKQGYDAVTGLGSPAADQMIRQFMK